eukprot:Pgem_evm1s4603
MPDRVCELFNLRQSYRYKIANCQFLENIFDFDYFCSTFSKKPSEVKKPSEEEENEII